MSDNEIHQTDKPQIPPTRANKDLELLRETGKHLDKFLCQGDQRTDLEDSEVIIVSILDAFANSPYPMSAKIAKERGIPFDADKYKMKFLAEFLTNFKKFRISRKRLGRTEDKQVMMSYMNMIADALREHEKGNSPGYLK